MTSPFVNSVEAIQLQKFCACNFDDIHFDLILPSASSSRRFPFATCRSRHRHVIDIMDYVAKEHEKKAVLDINKLCKTE